MFVRSLTHANEHLFVFAGGGDKGESNSWHCYVYFRLLFPIQVPVQQHFFCYRFCVAMSGRRCCYLAPSNMSSESYSPLKYLLAYQTQNDTSVTRVPAFSNLPVTGTHTGLFTRQCFLHWSLLCGLQS